MSKNFQNFMKPMDLLVQEAQKTPSRQNQKSTQGHIDKLLKEKGNEKRIKATGVKWLITYKGTSV